MARREAREESPTAMDAVMDSAIDEAPAAEQYIGSGIAILDDLRNAYLAGGREESIANRERRMHGLMASRRAEVTMTLLLMVDDGGPIANLLNDALLGQRWNADAEKPVASAIPLHARIELQSLRMRCPRCEDGSCGRVGKYHDVVYKTGQKSGDKQMHETIQAMGGTVEDNVRCRVDPETGRFSLPPLEAKKALRQWGEHAVRAKRRWVDREHKKGDRWLIREVAHHDKYANATIHGAVRQDEQPMVVL